LLISTNIKLENIIYIIVAHNIDWSYPKNDDKKSL